MLEIMLQDGEEIKQAEAIDLSRTSCTSGAVVSMAKSSCTS